ncbi:hypothetical protein LTR62_008102 [Meristemomyces frigidus]|uniref:Protein kinase domain-containing protein n=1 Tax=Meristemomyces frigidus TaxID=1508187 RepID=A0AAN7TBJ1_9PEZI|nr:hypothetical protein LTR62_008102 [Meristemomyces frigidus]
MSTTNPSTANQASATSFNAEESKNILIKQIYHAATCTIYITLSREEAEKYVPASMKRPLSLKRLRQSLQAIKVISHEVQIRRQINHAANTEIKALKLIHNPGHENLLTFLDHDTTGPNARWHTTPLCSLNNLAAIISHWQQTTTHAPSTAFAFHLGASLAQALLYLHGGIRENGKVVSNWPAIAHRDFHPGNIFFRPHEVAGSYKDYPCIVLSDFDNAEIETPSRTRAHIVQFQGKDLKDLSVHMSIVSHHVGGPGFARWVQHLGEIERPEKGAERYDNGLKALAGLAKVGLQRRTQLYQPLEAGFLALFQQPAVSDEELQSVLQGAGDV